MLNCSRTEAVIVNVCLFMQNFRLTRITFTPLTFCVIKNSLNHNFMQLNSIGGNLILKSQIKSAPKLVPFFTLNLVLRC